MNLCQPPPNKLMFRIFLYLWNHVNRADKSRINIEARLGPAMPVGMQVWSIFVFIYQPVYARMCVCAMATNYSQLHLIDKY